MNYYIKNFIQKPGQHQLMIGKTGTGKTQFLYQMLDLFRFHAPGETVVWHDIAKGDEILPILELWGKKETIQIIIPKGCDMIIPEKYADRAEFIYVDDASDVWHNLVKGSINIVSIRPFYLDPLQRVIHTANLFESLVELALNHNLPRPLCNIYDEFHNVAPARGYGYATSSTESRMQNASVNTIRQCTQQLRAEKIRWVASSHQWTQIQAGVRASFEWIAIKRGAWFPRNQDQEHLAEFNKLWRKTPTNQAYITIPDGYFIGPLNLAFYADGSSLGHVKYVTQYKYKAKRFDQNEGKSEGKDAREELRATIEGNAPGVQSSV